MTLGYVSRPHLLAAMTLFYTIAKHLYGHWSKLLKLQRKKSNLPVPDSHKPFLYDVCDQILMSLPDYQTLQATVLSSKLFHVAYKSHRAAIIQTVMARDIGPVFCFSRARYHSMTTNTDNELLFAPQMLARVPMTPTEAAELIRNRETTSKFEDLFSRL